MAQLFRNKGGLLAPVLTAVRHRFDIHSKSSVGAAGSEKLRYTLSGSCPSDSCDINVTSSCTFLSDSAFLEPEIPLPTMAKVAPFCLNFWNYTAQLFRHMHT